MHDLAMHDPTLSLLDRALAGHTLSADGIHLLCVTVRDQEGNEAIVWDELEVG